MKNYNILHIIFSLLLLFHSFSLVGQSLKYNFFEYTLDSVKSRNVSINTPTNGNSGNLTTAIITDYFGNTRVQLLTSVFTSKNDTLIAIHSLFNGVGNLTLELEIPLAMHYLIENKTGFAGLSINNKMSTLINNGQSFEKSIVSNDFGFNAMINFRGEFDAIGLKLILRNALVYGNSPLVEKFFSQPSKIFFYNAVQLKIRAKYQQFVINIPIIIEPFKGSYKNVLPIYAGMSMNF